MPTVQPGRIKGLDGLRGFAALLVLCGHAAAFLLYETEKGLFSRTLQTSGVLGVDLFFVVSGFLITGILIDGRSRPAALWTFWERRALRILPLAVLYLSVLFAIARSPLAPLEYRSFEGWGFFLFFLGNIHIAVVGSTPPELAIMWSLAIEEQFYLLWPFLVRAGTSLLVARVGLLLVIVSPLLRQLTAWSLTPEAAIVLTPGRLDGLAGGALLAVAIRSAVWPRIRQTVGASAPIAAALSLVILAGPGLPGLHLPFPQRSWLTNLSWCVLVGGVLAEPRQWLARLFESRLLVWFGERCYGTYVWHVLAARITLSLMRNVGLDSSPLNRMLLWLVVVVVVVELSWRCLEKPFMGLAQRRSGRDEGARGQPSLLS